MYLEGDALRSEHQGAWSFGRPACSPKGRNSKFLRERVRRRRTRVSGDVADRLESMIS